MVPKLAARAFGEAKRGTEKAVADARERIQSSLIFSVFSLLLR